MTDTWVATGMSGAPEARSHHSAVWTGNEMIVWGGGGETSPWLDSGGRYRPSTDSWTAVAMAGAPSPRYLHSATWTGAEMVVWGGATATFDTNTGGRYDPSTDSWRSTSVLNAPAPRTTNTAVWTGTEMLVWGGQHYSGVYTYYGDGARYDPSSDVWIPMSLVGAPGARAFFGHVWTGTEMILWGGCTYNSGGACAGEVPTGARYEPASDTWTSTTLQSAPAPRSVHTAVWTGDEMIVWGGFSKDNGTYTNTGGRYRPGTPTFLPDDLHGSPADR
jgi:N-acetylneuraminic acid mutarotase